VLCGVIRRFLIYLLIFRSKYLQSSVSLIYTLCSSHKSISEFEVYKIRDKLLLLQNLRPVNTEFRKGKELITSLKAIASRS